MKKQYIQPQMVAIEMKYTTTLMSGSGTLGVGTGTMSADDALSRRGNFFDDEEEEY